MSHESVSVVIPVYQNRESLSELLRQLFLVHAEHASNVELFVIFVDDGSTDGSWDVLTRLQKDNPSRVSLIKLSRNFGQVNAILAGYAHASSDAVITMSADLQDPPELLAEMIDKWRSGSDVVIAHRIQRDDDLSSRIFSRAAYAVARRAHPDMPSGGFDCMLMSRRALDILLSFPSRHRFLQGDILWLGLPTSFIPYARRARPHGRSTWSFSRKFKYFTDLLLDSSFVPIQLMSRLGFLIAFLGILYAVVIVFARLANETPWPGWAPIMITLLIVGGLIMVMLGVIGEYLWRIYDDIKGRPRYVVKETWETNRS